MLRLFIAIHLPPSVKAGLSQLRTFIPTARWSDASQLHLTLRFLGEVADAQLNKIEDALDQITAAPFDMSLKGVGCFPENVNKPTRVLWAGISAPPMLFNLQQQIEHAMMGAGFGASDKPFSPHITLARLKTEKPLSAVKAFLDAHKGYISPSFQVTSFALVESQLHPSGAIYSDRKRFTLR